MKHSSRAVIRSKGTVCADCWCWLGMIAQRVAADTGSSCYDHTSLPVSSDPLTGPNPARPSIARDATRLCFSSVQLPVMLNEARALRPPGLLSLTRCLPIPPPYSSAPATVDVLLFKEPPQTCSWLTTFAFDFSLCSGSSFSRSSP